MRVPGAFRVALVAAAALSLSSQADEMRALSVSGQQYAAAVDEVAVHASHVARVLAASPVASEEEEPTEAPKKKRKKKAAAATEEPAAEKKTKKKKEEDAEDVDTTIAELEALEEEVEEAEAAEAKAEAETKKTKKKKAAPAPEEEPEKPVKKKAKKKVAETEATEAMMEERDEKEKKDEEKEEKEGIEEKEEKEEEPAAEDDDEGAGKDKKTKGKSKDSSAGHSSEGSAEIDKIDPNNEDGWISVYEDPPLLVIKASLYAFIAYNDTEVCDTFNMTMNAVEQKEVDNGLSAYHVVAYINCTKDGEDETQGRFILNFIPEGKRLLLTECGHREDGQIVNWLRIQEEVPECMTPKQRKEFLTQPMKHIHASNGSTDGEAVQTDFLTRLEELDGEEVAIFGSATVALIAVIVVLVVFCMRKRKAQMDLERTIAGAKAEHAVEDDDLQTEVEEKATKERKGLMDSAKAKNDDPDMEEGSFVNSPAVRV